MATRRDFLKQSGWMLGTCLATPSLLQSILAATGDATGPLADRVLVLIQLAGGNDSLNTVIPYAEPLYGQLRRRIGIPRAEIIELDAGTGLHPALSPLKSWFDGGNATVLHSVGYPNPNRSHFIATDIWQTGSPEEPQGTGWIGRANDASPTDRERPFKAIGMGNRVAGALKSSREPVPSLNNLDDFRFFPREDDRQRQDDLRAFAALHGTAVADSGRSAFMQTETLRALNASEELRRVVGAYRSRVRYPNSGLANQLRLIGQMIASPLGIRAYHATIGGFDTHANQVQQHARLLGELGQALAAFMQDLEAMGKSDRVVVMTYSEFSRRVQENGSGGTDHGAAGAMLMLGHPLKGGIVGQAPGLAPEQLDKGDLAWQIDFRQVYATILESWLGAPAEKVLGQRYEPLPVFG